MVIALNKADLWSKYYQDQTTSIHVYTLTQTHLTCGDVHMHTVTVTHTCTQSQLHTCMHAHTHTLIYI